MGKRRQSPLKTKGKKEKKIELHDSRDSDKEEFTSEQLEFLGELVLKATEDEKFKADLFKAVNLADGIQQSYAYPEIHSESQRYETISILWPKDRLHGLAALIRKQRKLDETKRINSSSRASILLSTTSSTAKHEISNIFKSLLEKAEISKLGVEYKGELSMLYSIYDSLSEEGKQNIQAAISLYDCYQRDQFLNEHNARIITEQYSKEDLYHNGNITWISVPKDFVDVLYSQLETIERKKYLTHTEILKSFIPRPDIYFKELKGQHRTIQARKEAKVEVHSLKYFPQWLKTFQEQEQAKLIDEYTEKLFEIKLIENSVERKAAMTRIENDIFKQYSIVQLKLRKQACIDIIDELIPTLPVYSDSYSQYFGHQQLETCIESIIQEQHCTLPKMPEDELSKFKSNIKLHINEYKNKKAFEKICREFLNEYIIESDKIQQLDQQHIEVLKKILDHPNFRNLPIRYHNVLLLNIKCAEDVESVYSEYISPILQVFSKDFLKIYPDDESTTIADQVVQEKFNKLGTMIFNAKDGAPGSSQGESLGLRFTSSIRDHVEQVQCDISLVLSFQKDKKFFKGNNESFEEFKFFQSQLKDLMDAHHRLDIIENDEAIRKLFIEKLTTNQDMSVLPDELLNRLVQYCEHSDLGELLDNQNILAARVQAYFLLQVLQENSVFTALPDSIQSLINIKVSEVSSTEELISVWEPIPMHLEFLGVLIANQTFQNIAQDIQNQILRFVIDNQSEVLLKNQEHILSVMDVIKKIQRHRAYNSIDIQKECAYYKQLLESPWPSQEWSAIRDEITSLSNTQMGASRNALTNTYNYLYPPKPARSMPDETPLSTEQLELKRTGEMFLTDYDCRCRVR